jgi:predicted RNase H-like HicB family nuclease
LIGGSFELEAIDRRRDSQSRQCLKKGIGPGFFIDGSVTKPAKGYKRPFRVTGCAVLSGDKRQPSRIMHSPLEKTMLLTAVLTAADEGGFIALNPETGTTTQGETIAEAVQNLKEATSLYLEEFSLEPSLLYAG